MVPFTKRGTYGRLFFLTHALATLHGYIKRTFADTSQGQNTVPRRPLRRACHERSLKQSGSLLPSCGMSTQSTHLGSGIDVSCNKAEQAKAQGCGHDMRPHTQSEAASQLELNHSSKRSLLAVRPTCENLLSNSRAGCGPASDHTVYLSTVTYCHRCRRSQDQTMSPKSVPAPWKQ